MTVNAKNTPSSDPVRVLIVDSQATVREGLSNRLNADPNIEVVGIAATADEALTQATDCKADIAVIDAQLPEKAGPRLCSQIRRRHPTTQCVLLTASSIDHNDVEHAGAVAVVLKQLFGQELADTIHKLANSD